MDEAAPSQATDSNNPAIVQRARASLAPERDSGFRLNQSLPSPAAAEAIRSAAADRRELVVGLRRRLHQIPELAFEEVETTRFVESFLVERGIRFERSRCGTGGVAVLGEEPVPAVILRAELDALPLEEGVEHPFRSRRPGRMHACGHDAHVAVLLAAADAVAAGAVPRAGPVVCVFQPAEEARGGCRTLLEEGLLDRHPARAAVALHTWPELATGTLGVTAGPVMASMDSVRIRFYGKGGHGAFPQACIDPVPMAAEAVLAFQTLVSRRTDPLEPGVFTIGSVRGGTAPNIIPDVVELEGTIRAFDPSVRAALLEGVERVAAGVAAAHGGRAEVRIEEGYPVTRNDADIAAVLSASFKMVLGEAAVVPARRTMAAEDMSFLLERVAGCYLQLGCSAEPRAAQPLHSCRFDLDEGCLPAGVTALLTAACVLGAAEPW